MRWPGIEPQSSALKATMLLFTPSTFEGIFACTSPFALLTSYRKAKTFLNICIIIQINTQVHAI